MNGPAQIEVPKKLSTTAATGLLAAALGTSIIAALITAVGVVWIWFANTRADGLAAFEVSFLAAGAFSSPIACSLLARRRLPGMYLIGFAVLPWLALAAYATVQVCKESFITWNNWRWILKSGDQRLYELDWIMRGWQAIGVATLLGLVVSRMIVSRPTLRHDPTAVR